MIAQITSSEIYLITVNDKNSALQKGVKYVQSSQ